MADNRILAIEIVRLIPSKGMAIVSFREKRRVSSLKGNVLKGGLSRGWKFSSKNYITRYRDPEISRDGIQLRFYRCDKAAKLLLFFPGKEESRDTISAGEKILSNTVRPFSSQGWNGGGATPFHSSCGRVHRETSLRTGGRRISCSNGFQGNAILGFWATWFYLWIRY